MAASTRLLPKQSPTDGWSLREKIALACSVMRSGDNNWVSVSRAIKPYGESNRPTDWFSQKNCALQYSDLLEKVETPKRKRGERELTETPGDIIVRKLTIERIEELKRIVQQEEEKFKKLKQDVEQVYLGQCDDNLDEIEGQIISEKQTREDAERLWAEKMEAREQALAKNRKSGAVKVKIDFGDSMQDSPADSTSLEEDSNLSVPSVSTPMSTSSQDVKPPLPGSGLLIGHDVGQSQPKEEVLQTGSSIVETGAAGDAGSLQPKEEKDLMDTSYIKQEIPGIDVTVKEEPRDVDDSEKCGPEEMEDSEQSDDDFLSARGDGSGMGCIDRPSGDRPSGQAERGKKIFVQVVDDDKDLDGLDSVSEGRSKDDDQPLSPASSVMSNDTDGGLSMVRGDRGRRSRGGKSRRGRRSKRLTRNRMVEDDKMKESETSSKAESSDDEGGDTTLPESDDTASNATGKHHQSFTESIPNSPASFAPGDTEDEKAHKIWKKSIMLVWRAAANHKYANVFSHPVTEEIAPGYHSIVMRPLDLSTVKKNIENGQIRTTAEFQRDMMFMFTNAIMYNNSDHDVFHMATEMYDDVMRHIEQYVNTQMMVQGGEPKLLRTSRRSEAHSDKEDEPKRKRTTSDQDGGKVKKRKV